MKRCLPCFVLLVLFAAATSASAAGMIIVEDTSWWPGPFPPHPLPPPWPHPLPPPQPHIFAPLEVNSVQVNTRITDQLAVTKVDQEIFNPNAARVEGTFVFPVPKGAHLDKFSIEIDGRQVDAELLPADKARRLYEDIVRKLKDPALLEYADRDLFKAHIFPIEPHGKKRVQLCYTQLLKSDDGLISYLLPLSTEKFSCQPIRNVSVKVQLETRRPLKSIYSPSHSVEIRRDGPNRATAGYEGANLLPDADFTLYFSPEKDELGINLLTHKSGSGDGYFLLLASPGVDAKERQIVMKDVVFVLDTSGSMAGKKLDQARKALAFCIENLNDGDRFEILRFSTEVEPLFDRLVDANRQNRDKAGQFAKELKAIGGTAIDDALRTALALPSRRTQADDSSSPLHTAHSQLRTGARPYVIIFLTDGQPTIGVTAEEQILANLNKESDGHTRIFCFGIGTDVNTHLLDKISDQTHAFSQYVLPEEDLEVKVSSFFSKIKEPVLSDPVLEFTGDVHASKLYPSSLPDLFKGEQLVLVGRYSGQGHSAATIEGAVNGAARKFTYEVRFPSESSENDFIPRLWATRRVGYLLDEIRLHGENAELGEEITDLARQYAIVTPYTAYLILEDEKQREVPMPLRSMQNFERDRQLREEAAQSWQQFSKDKSGDSGVASALSGSALKSAIAAAPAAASADALFFRRYGQATTLPGGAIEPGPESTHTRLAQSSQAAQFVAGKTFFRNDQQWLDSAVQKNPGAKRIRIRFASPEYFDFLAGNPQAAPWLALGPNVQFLLNNAIYDIY